MSSSVSLSITARAASMRENTSSLLALVEGDRVGKAGAKAGLRREVLKRARSCCWFRVVEHAAHDTAEPQLQSCRFCSFLTQQGMIY